MDHGKWNYVLYALTAVPAIEGIAIESDVLKVAGVGQLIKGRMSMEELSRANKLPREFPGVERNARLSF
jgi:hypothetical protein